VIDWPLAVELTSRDPTIGQPPIAFCHGEGVCLRRAACISPRKIKNVLSPIHFLVMPRSRANDLAPDERRKLRLLVRTYLSFEDAIEEAREDGFPIDHYRWAIGWSNNLRRKLWAALLETKRWIGTADDAEWWARKERSRLAGRKAGAGRGGK
jgi:hypothetical protein